MRQEVRIYDGQTGKIIVEATLSATRLHKIIKEYRLAGVDPVWEFVR